MFSRRRRQFLKDESGQGITEYGAILSFVALLIAIVFGLAKGKLAPAISQSFSNTAIQLNKLNAKTVTSQLVIINSPKLS